MPDEPRCVELTCENAGLGPAKELLHYPISVSVTSQKRGLNTFENDQRKILKFHKVAELQKKGKGEKKKGFSCVQCHEQNI